MFDRSIMEENSQEIQYCFPNNSLSCFKEVKHEAEYAILYTFISLLCVFTVFLNLLVIISISHFKKLHTPTNLLILSLAVADLIVGLIVIPLMGITFIESCWYFGETFCSLFLFIAFMVVSASLGNLVFISVDRYIAVSDPLRYTVRVTIDKVVCCIIINWLCSSIYSVIILYNTMFYPDTHNRCYGDCSVYFKFEHVVADLIVTFVAPSSVIMSIYVKIFCVAKHQAKVVNSVAGASRSQRKAAKTLGIVVMVYFMCWIPYYIVTLIDGNESSVEFNVTCWILYMNSCMNPLIYALFYKWFRISAKHIVTLKILKPSSEYFDISF
ncbi:trace amine-associated receptor 13c-like [Rhinichthys klamathensis goyatoka]|uniref:trace amine-associated receptor 13c-like n=1 Tax=Rhinichthys klamathensis goyatoka TaxID=3034132 RepID=UPI0024B4B9DA|nr:trace amine-associated receptor 13c-like [Rhinichthys klamathensis goyatoka]